MAPLRSRYEDRAGSATVPFVFWFYVNVASGTDYIIKLLEAHDMVLAG